MGYYKIAWVSTSAYRFSRYAEGDNPVEAVANLLKDFSGWYNGVAVFTAQERCSSVVHEVTLDEANKALTAIRLKEEL